MKNINYQIFLIGGITIFLLWGCSTSKPPGIAEDLCFNLHSGLNKIGRGTDEKEIIKSLGNPDKIDKTWEESDGEKYYNYYSKGIQISTKSGEVMTVFLYYKSSEFSSFSGKTEVANGKTTIDDIAKAFGVPSYTSVSTVSEYGEFPGTKEAYLSYDSLGVSFSFYDKKLGNIRFFKELK